MIFLLFFIVLTLLIIADISVIKEGLEEEDYGTIVCILEISLVFIIGSIALFCQIVDFI
jgi:hypothetical protein